MAESIELVDRTSSSINDASPLVVKAPPGAKLSKSPTVTLKGKEVPLESFLEQDRKENHPHFLPTRVDLREVSFHVQALAAPAKIGTISKMAAKGILSNISFSLLPGEATALLGAPRSGKTTIFEVITGKKKSQGEITGDVRIAGASPSTVHRHIAYIPQGDSHLANLTVRETLWFAARLQMPESYTDAQVSDRVDITMQILGLTSAANTIVGDALTRGISGGEKRRVTIGVELVKGPRCLLLDEANTGLDSATALGVGQALRAISRSGPPVLASLLQPSWELLNTFDKLLLISKGQVVYWGPVEEALPYFESLGYGCPSHYNAAEFLAEVIEAPTKFRDVESGGAVVTDADFFINSWNSSELRTRMITTADAKQLPKVESKSSLTTETTTMIGEVETKYPTGALTQLRLLLWRGFLIMRRDLKRQFWNMGMQIFIALYMVAIFFNVGWSQRDAAAKLAVAFFAVARISFNAVAFIPVMIADKELFFKQHGAKYFSPFPFVLAQLVTGLPFLIAEAFVFGSIVYWGTGMPHDAGRFFFFVFILLLSSLNFNFITRTIVATFSSILHIALFSTGMMGTLLLLSGFMIARNRPAKFWLAVVYTSPMSYATDAIAITALWGQRLHCNGPEYAPPTNSSAYLAPYPQGFNGAQICPYTRGEDVLRYRQFHSDWVWRWWDVLFLIGSALFWATVHYVLLRWWSKPLPPPAGMISNDVSAKLSGTAAEYQKRPEVTLSWEDITYSLKVKGKQLDLIKPMHGYVKSAMLLALMGPSGAGKTTLLDILAHRKTQGEIGGNISLNGSVPDREMFSRMVGYVEQTDVHFANQTVLEALEFAAECRLPQSFDREHRKAVVSRVMDLLDLRSIAGALVGGGPTAPGGISKEQRRRLTIGVEMAADPQILFLDEPTSGLDSLGAEKVMSAIEKVAQSGTACVCSIHQPSTRIFAKCTHLLLIRKGGDQVYFGELGPNFETMCRYFSSQGLECPRYRNPAEFILEISGAGIQSSHIPQVKEGYWAQSEELKELKRILQPMKGDKVFLEKKSSSENEIEKEKKGFLGRHLPLVFSRPFQLPLRRQFAVNAKRWAFGWWRAPQAFALNIGRAIFLGVVFGTVYWQRGSDQLAILERVSALYFWMVFANLSSLSAIPVVFYHRPVYYRERAESMYRTIAYGTALIMVEVPNLCLSALFFGIPFYWMAGLRPTAGAFFFFLLTISLLSITCTAFAQAIAAASPNPDTAGLVYTALFSIITMTAGFFRPRDQIPKYLMWIHYSSFTRYSLEALNVNEFASNPKMYRCKNGGGFEVNVPLANGSFALKRYCPFENGDAFLRSYGFDARNKWWDVLALCGFYVVFICLVLLCLRFVRHLKR